MPQKCKRHGTKRIGALVSGVGPSGGRPKLTLFRGPTDVPRFAEPIGIQTARLREDVSAEVSQLEGLKPIL